MGVYQIQWASDSLVFPEGSYMMISIHPDFEIVDEYCKTMTGFVAGSLDTSNLICRRNSATAIFIGGYAQISTSTTLTITLRLQIVYNSISNRSPNANIAVYSENAEKIIEGSVSSFSLTMAGYGSSELELVDEMLQPLQK